ncbi:hypothetical protein BCU70_02420 [Vibrio sp. 10N.286.49.C2]|nr:hypothetical protein BCU70_02420 [Vibrio sp. 10N.286.49.C2]PMH53639.1 hypothetical protein BCU66_12415 [Vibrio sp. 10N.286.49.B1]PMH79044.1 hypothetical protein BCU58_06900 [Vibrio sp. 10N.286.48.B7]
MSLNKSIISLKSDRLPLTLVFVPNSEVLWGINTIRTKIGQDCTLTKHEYFEYQQSKQDRNPNISDLLNVDSTDVNYQ